MELTRSKSPLQKERSISPLNPSNLESSDSPVCHRPESPKSNSSNVVQHSSHTSANITDLVQQREVRDDSYERASHISGSSMGLKLTSSSSGNGNAIIRENGPIDKILPSPVIDRKDFDFNKVNNGKCTLIAKLRKSRM